MKKNLFVFLLLLIPCLQASAQISLRSHLDFTAYLQYEPITVKATIGNQMGRVAVFNVEEDDPRFYYTVRDKNGYILSARKGISQPHPVMIPPRKSETITNNILEYFAIQTPGYYSVQPSVDWRGKTYSGEKKHFEITRGREILRTAGFVPSDGTPRLYRLYHMNRKRQDHLLLRIDDEDAHLCYGVFPLGRTISSVPPILAVDSDAQIHVVFRASPQVHVYATYSPMGYLMNSQIFDRNYQGIELLTQPDGSIIATGTVEERNGNTIPFVESILDKKDEKKSRSRRE